MARAFGPLREIISLLLGGRVPISFMWLLGGCRTPSPSDSAVAEPCCLSRRLLPRWRSLYPTIRGSGISLPWQSPPPLVPLHVLISINP